MEWLVCGGVSVLILFVMSFTFFMAGIQEIRKRKRLKATSKRMIVDIEPGTVEVEGRVRPVGNRMLIAPLSGQECIRYQLQVEEYVQTSRDNSRWVEVFERTMGRYFILEDESGKVVVEPGSDHHGMFRSYTSKQTAFKDLEGKAKTFAQEHDIKLKHQLTAMNKHINVSERILIPRRFLYILGNAEESMLPVEARNDMSVNPYMLINDGKMIISENNEKGTEKLNKKSIRFNFIMAIISFMIGVVISLILYFFFI